MVHIDLKVEDLLYLLAIDDLVFIIFNLEIKKNNKEVQFLLYYFDGLFEGKSQRFCVASTDGPSSGTSLHFQQIQYNVKNVNK